MMDFWTIFTQDPLTMLSVYGAGAGTPYVIRMGIRLAIVLVFIERLWYIGKRVWIASKWVCVTPMKLCRRISKRKNPSRESVSLVKKLIPYLVFVSSLTACSSQPRSGAISFEDDSALAPFRGSATTISPPEIHPLSASRAFNAGVDCEEALLFVRFCLTEVELNDSNGGVVPSSVSNTIRNMEMVRSGLTPVNPLCKTLLLTLEEYQACRDAHKILPLNPFNFYMEFSKHGND